MKHLRLFPNSSVRNSVLADIDYKILSKTDGEPGVGIYQGTWVNPRTLPFYIDVRGAVTLAATSGLQMSTDGETWTDTAATTLSSGRTYFRVASDQSSPLKPDWTEDSNSDYDIGGNINSLVTVNFENNTNCYSFYDWDSAAGFFRGKSKLKSAGNLILPATTLTGHCYQTMFMECSSLTTAPELPATTLSSECYSGMFSDCTSLTKAPTTLPAATLEPRCYMMMFMECSSLTTAPTILATTLATQCCSIMFTGCTSLTTTQATLPATIHTDYDQNCYDAMFMGCTSLTTAPELPSTTVSGGCYSGMFSGCTSLTTAPELPATDLEGECYSGMFSDCTNLNYIKCLATKHISDGTSEWVSGVAATGTFVKASDASWTTGNNGIPSGWTTQNA